MLPPSLVSIYHQYKEDTNAVAAWLASTAKSRGYTSKAASSSNAPTTPTTPTTTTTGPPASKRLKGKARKDEKAALEQSHHSSTNPSNPEYVIAINEFVPLAKFIVGCKKPAVSVPLSFTNTLNRVISTRSGFSKKLATLCNNTDASSDSSHAYFVCVLEVVREVLKPCVPPAAPDPPAASSSADPVGEIGGKFASLSVEDPSEAFLNAPDIERPKPAENDKATYKAEPQEELTEIIFAYDLLLKDLSKIRKRIAWIWVKYNEGDIDLITAAIATNTACDLGRKMTEEMAPMFKPHGGLIEVAKKFYHQKCLDLGFHHVQGPCPGRFSARIIYDTYDLADQTYMIPIFCLEELEREICPGGLPVTGDRQFEIYDHSVEWASLPNTEKFNKDRVVMWEMACETKMMIHHLPSLLVDEEFVRGMRELQGTREIPMSLLFAAQVFLDIYHHLGDKILSTHSDFMCQLSHMDSDLKLHLDFIQDGYTKGFAYSEHEALSRYREEIKLVQSDPIHVLKALSAAREGLPAPSPNLTILKHSPVISGLFLFRMRRQIYNTGLELANKNRSILSPMHLYNALRQQELLSTQEAPSGCWQDMELLCRLMGVESFFVGERPKKGQDYMKNLLLQTGMTVAAFSKSQKHNTAPASNRFKSRFQSKKGARLMKMDGTPVMDMFVDRYVCKKEQFEWTSQAVESIVSRSVHHQKRRGDSKLNRASKATGPQMTPEELIESLVSALHAESLTLALPFLTLQRSGWGMLRAVRDACEDLLVHFDGPDYIKYEVQLPAIVCLILSELKKGDDRLLVKAGEAVKEKLRKGEGHNAIRHLHHMGYCVTSLKGDKFENVYNPDTDTVILDVGV